MTEASAAAAPRDGGRMVFVDALRVAVIVMVVAHHASQPYGPTGGEWPITDPSNSEWLAPFYIVNAAFGMGLLFLLAGYFVPKSYDRIGARRFLSSRWIRIGIPLAIFVLLVNVPVAFLLESPRLSPGEFVHSLYDSGLQNAYVHLWFLGHLLLYSAAYVGWRLIADRKTERSRREWPVPSHSAIVGFVVVLALATWVVRWWYPIDEWVPLFFVVAAEPAHLVQYVALFAVGVIAYRGDWLRRLSTKTGMIWLAIGLVAAVGIYVVRLSASDRWSDIYAGGGFGWQSLLASTWEALICVGMCLGLIVLFRQVFHRTNRLLVAMAAASYAAYILHLMIVVGLQAGMEGVDLPALAKFAMVFTFGVLLAFGIGHLSRRVPGVRSVLGTTPSKADTTSESHTVKP